MKANVVILETNMVVTYDFKITSHGSPMIGPSFNDPGSPAEPCEFDIEIVELRFPEQHADVTLEMPEWLKDMLTTHLLERDDVYQAVERADHESEPDPDYLLDRMRDDGW